MTETADKNEILTTMELIEIERFQVEPYQNVPKLYLKEFQNKETLELETPKNITNRDLYKKLTLSMKQSLKSE